MDITPDTDWQPGDPLYSPGSYTNYLFNWRDDSDSARCAPCHDSASWPAPRAHQGLGDRDELGELIARVHADREAGAA